MKHPRAFVFFHLFFPSYFLFAYPSDGTYFFCWRCSSLPWIHLLGCKSGHIQQSGSPNMSGCIKLGGNTTQAPSRPSTQQYPDSMNSMPLTVRYGPCRPRQGIPVASITSFRVLNCLHILNIFTALLLGLRDLAPAFLWLSHTGTPPGRRETVPEYLSLRNSLKPPGCIQDPRPRFIGNNTKFSLPLTEPTTSCSDHVFSPSPLNSFTVHRPPGYFLSHKMMQMQSKHTAGCKGNILICALALFWLPTTWAFNHVFDIREAPIASVHDALFTHSTTCRDIVSSFIARIEEFNPSINAVISLNSLALSTADHLDQRLAAGNITGALFCVPVLLKDNYDAVGMSTTGGCQGLAHNKPLTDAPTVRALMEAGAVILGKTNLHEMAFEGLTVSSLGGQTVNPYDLTRTPGGSSGGSGAAVAANFAVLATGTDTVNSLRSPASANSLFSFRPTRGLISRTGVIPVSSTQDTVGAMARNPSDLAVALTVMASVGLDHRDNVTALTPSQVRHQDYSASLYGGDLKGLRFGLLHGFFNHTPSAETTPVNDVMASMVAKLTATGAEVINITEPLYDTLAIAKLDVQAFEFKDLLDAYLALATANHTSQSPEVQHPTSFDELYTTGSTNFLVIPAQHHFIKKAWHSSARDAAYLETQGRIHELTRALESTFATNNLDAIIYPEQKNLVVKIGSPSQSGRNGILAALTGHPVVCVPAGFSAPSDDAPLGVPIGMEILGRPWSEGMLLNIASHISELVPVRRMPPFANGTVEPREYEGVPSIMPDAGNIPAAYPLGAF
ncbi:amidase signature domain-containing protein [Chaetomium fimeti]|uniref:Amidase signature domain-containing protein n=1 Tax=Chaetomium fimeti TaxID=1854472 RepID=A0AAE0HKK2_9PEZI|nr:amidase signature domain-containing protein [Chaetomium fimeti]